MSAPELALVTLRDPLVVLLQERPADVVVIQGMIEPSPYLDGCLSIRSQRIWTQRDQLEAREVRTGQVVVSNQAVRTHVRECVQMTTTFVIPMENVRGIVILQKPKS